MSVELRPLLWSAIRSRIPEVELDAVRRDLGNDVIGRIEVGAAGNAQGERKPPRRSP